MDEPTTRRSLIVAAYWIDHDPSVPAAEAAGTGVAALDGSGAFVGVHDDNPQLPLILHALERFDLAEAGTFYRRSGAREPGPSDYRPHA